MEIHIKDHHTRQVALQSKTDKVQRKTRCSCHKQDDMGWGIAPMPSKF